MSESKEGLDKLFFELASENRLNILQEAQVSPLKMTEIARKLNMTDTETIRQLQRLSEASLIQKLPSGSYELTTYAKLVLDLSSSLGFVSRFREYFREHDAFGLPFEFRARLGELSGCKLISASVNHLNKTAEMFYQAKERIDTVVVGTKLFIDILRQRSQEGVKMRWLMQESFIPNAPSALSSWKKIPEIRTTPLVLGWIVVTERAASLSIRQNDRAMSLSSFYGEDPSSIKWTQELFNHEFERAKPWRP